jgi:hypothetical protein
MKALIVIVILAIGAYAAYNAYKASQEETKEARTVKSLPPSVQHVVAQMDGGSQAAFFNEYEQKKKKKSVGWILWFFLGFHYLYVKKVGMQFAFWFTCEGLGIWWIVDFFRMPSIIRSANEQIARECLQTLHIGAAFASMTPSGSIAPAAPALMVQPIPPSDQPRVSFDHTAPPAAPPAAAPAAVAPQAGQWVADPRGRHELRYHDGKVWTHHVSDKGVTSTDPLN